MCKFTSGGSKTHDIWFGSTVAPLEVALRQSQGQEEKSKLLKTPPKIKDYYIALDVYKGIRHNTTTYYYGLSSNGQTFRFPIATSTFFFLFFFFLLSLEN